MKSCLHHAILTGIINDGFAPTIETLPVKFQQSKDEIIRHLKGLEESHGVVLHPKSS